MNPNESIIEWAQRAEACFLRGLTWTQFVQSFDRSVFHLASDAWNLANGKADWTQSQ